VSSLRIESLRLVWLETFLHVTETENLSAASREMGVDQSTVTRHMQALERWAGKPLLELYRGEDDGDEPGSMSRMTPAGVDLLEIAQEFVPRLKDFRTEKACRAELLDSLASIIAKILADLESKNPSQAAEKWRDLVTGTADSIEVALEWPMEILEKIANDFRILFKRYEWELKRERRFNRAKAKPTKSGRFIKVPPSPAE
jgi:molybdenum-dependent DNA-binding transcriptional regulator ModE